jgi:RNA polymerase sigma factor (sigma-70 family)
MEDVEDTLQEGLYKFMKFYEKNGFEQTGKLENYIFSICKNIWLKELVNRQKLKQSGSSIVEELKDDRWDLKEKYRKEALIDIAEKNIGLLSNKCQKVLNFRRDGLSCNEIAELLGLKNGQIAKDKHYRCKERLRELIKQDKAYREIINDE